MFIKSPIHKIEYSADMKGNYPLQIAAKYGKLQIIKYLIENKIIDIQNANSKNDKGFTGYHYASQGGHLIIMMYLDIYGVNNKIVTDQG